jgi:hypothetical protein
LDQGSFAESSYRHLARGITPRGATLTKGAVVLRTVILRASVSHAAHLFSLIDQF